MKKLLLFLLGFTVFFPLSAQYLHWVNWETMDSPSYQWIYPEEWREIAQEQAAFAEEISDQLNHGLMIEELEQYPLILYPFSMDSNGYVTPLVKHSLWYGTASFSGLGSLGWLELLNIHEGRHVRQFQALDRSTTGILRHAVGDLGIGLATVCTPSWVFEGDAVFMETLLSDSGRGRRGDFSRNLRILWDQETPPPYSSHSLPSRRRLPTNAYDFGYFMTSWMRYNYGMDALGELFFRQAQLPLPLWGTTRAMKRITGSPLRHNYNEFNRDMMDYFQSPEPWQSDIQWISSDESTWSYNLHLVVNHQGLHRLNYTPRHGRELETFYDQQWQKQASINPLNRLSGGGDTLVWDQLHQNQRYQHMSSSEIWIYRDGRVSRLFGPGSWFDPGLNDNGDLLALLEYQANSSVDLLVANLDGEILHRASLMDGDYGFWPSWSSDDSQILMVLQNSQGSQLVSYHWQSDEWQVLSPATPWAVRRPFWHNDRPAFLGDAGHGSTLFRIDDDQLQRLPLGSYGLSAAIEYQGQLVISSAESSQGEVVGTLDEIPWESVSWDEWSHPLEGYGLDLVFYDSPPPSIPDVDQEYPIEKYAADYFNIYSWGPITRIPYQSSGLEVPLSVLSQDPLGSNLWEAGLVYNINEERLSAQFFGQSNHFFTPIQLYLRQEIPMENESTLSQAALLLNFPLGYQRGNRNWILQFSTGIQGLLLQDDGELDYGLLYSGQGQAVIYGRKTVMDLLPRWYQHLGAYINKPIGNDNSRWGADLSSSAPLWLNSHISANLAMEHNSLGLSSNVPYPRGWNYEFRPELWKANLEYQIPLLHPEVELTRLLYFSRVRGTVFFDKIWSEGPMDFSDSHSSLGGEILFDFYGLQLPLELNMGLRYSYLIEEERSRVQFTILGAPLN